MAEKNSYPSDEAERFQVRMPPGLRDKLRKAAADNGRSMNSEIVYRLETGFQTEAFVRQAEIGSMPQYAELLTHLEWVRKAIEATLEKADAPEDAN